MDYIETPPWCLKAEDFHTTSFVKFAQGDTVIKLDFVATSSLNFTYYQICCEAFQVWDFTKQVRDRGQFRNQNCQSAFGYGSWSQVDDLQFPLQSYPFLIFKVQETIPNFINFDLSLSGKQCGYMTLKHLLEASLFVAA